VDSRAADSTCAATRRLSGDEGRLQLGDRGQLRGGRQIDAVERHPAAEPDRVLRSYKNAQIGVQQFVEYAGTPTNLTAVPQMPEKQINRGIELQSVWRATRALTLGLTTGYLDSYYENYLIPCNVFTLAPGCGPSVTTVNVAGENRRSMRPPGPYPGTQPTPGT